MTNPTPRGKTPAYKIIYNWDGAPLDFSEYPQSVEQLMQKTYAPIRDTQVGAMFWSLGGHEAEWPSETMPVTGDTVNRRYELVNSMRHEEGVRAMFERGENPYQAMIERGHELGVDVFASVRMNDNHLQGVLPEDMARTTLGGLTQMRKDHPEWCLGLDGAAEFFASSWNFAIPEVREHRLQHITEACQVAEWDGVELDWQRHAFHLPQDHGYRLRYTLTDLQRAVRRMTDQIAAERGRPFLLAVRVGTTMESCKRIGYDIETWVKEGLCDIVIAAGTIATDAGIEVEAFRDLLKGTGIGFYTGFDVEYAEARRLVSNVEWRDGWNRALAQGYWDRGVDGMYVFNWHGDKETRRALLTTMGAPETLEGTDKVYSAVHRQIRGKNEFRAGVEVNDRIYGETPVALHRTLTGDGPKFHVPIHDKVAEEAKSDRLEGVEIQIELEHYSAADQVAVTLDGKDLGNPTVRNVAAEDPDDPSDVYENSWLVWSLEPEKADNGMLEIQVRLMERDPRLKPPLVVRHVEVHVMYKS